MKKSTSKRYKQRPRRKRRVPRLKVLAYGAAVAASAAVIGAVAVDVTRYLGRSRRFAVMEVDVTGAQVLTPAEICRASAIPPGISIFDIDTAEVVRRLEALPRVRSAAVGTRPPCNVSITIEEREPVAAVRTTHLLEVDRDGVVLGPTTAEQSGAALPVITGSNVPDGLSAGDTLDGAAARQAVILSDLLVASGTVPLLGVKTLDISDPENLVMAVENVSAKILWGSGDYERKLAKLLAVWHTTGGRLPHSEYIDLRQAEFIPGK